MELKQCILQIRESIREQALSVVSGMKNSFSEVFVALASSKVDRLIAFYGELLAIAPKPNTSTYAEFQLIGLRLAIFTPKADNALEFTAANSGAMSLCIEVSNLEAMIDRLKALGYPPVGNIMHTSHGQEIYAYDPDGNRLILHQSPLGD